MEGQDKGALGEFGDLDLFSYIQPARRVEDAFMRQI